MVTELRNQLTSVSDKKAIICHLFQTHPDNYPIHGLPHGLLKCNFFMGTFRLCNCLDEYNAVKAELSSPPLNHPQSPTPILQTTQVLPPPTLAPIPSPQPSITPK
mmetsp:Transcript_11612/g.16425  ORF Transcript_11612/g.16425 Transcript_11612/m.16425 type:complete len:105 (+) Transcript_11612:502-816(+)